MMAASSISLSGLRPVAQLAASRAHGDRLRYMAGCRCAECRRANTEYEKTRVAARKAGDWNGIVPAARSRDHIARLSTGGVGKRQVADASGISGSIIQQIISGARMNVRALTERAILAVTLEAIADHAVIDAGPTWRLLDELISNGYSKAHLARELGFKSPALQVKRTQCTVRTAYDVGLLHQRLRCVRAAPTLRLVSALREEGFRQSRIETMLVELAQRTNAPAPDLTVRRESILASTASLVRTLHHELMEVPA